MNEELENQLEKLFDEFKLKTLKLVAKNNVKLLRDHSKTLKDEAKESKFLSSPRAQKNSRKKEDTPVKPQRRQRPPVHKKTANADDSSDDDSE